MLWLQHVFFIGCDTLITLQTSKKLLIVILCTVILTFNLSMSYAKANSAAVQFVEEGLKATYAGVVLSTLAVAQGASNTNDFVKEHGQKIYDTAKETYPKLSADMKANFAQSMSQVADGIVTVGDWITAALDSLKADPAINGSATISGLKYNFSSSTYYLTKSNPQTFFVLPEGFSDKQLFVSASYYSGKFYVRVGGSGSVGEYAIQYMTSSEGITKANSLNKILHSGNLSAALSALSGVGVSIQLKQGDLVLNPSEDSIYNQLDNWVRSRTNADHPEGKLGVYAPTEAWTTSGIRLGLDPTGTQLLTLPDGVPYDPVLHGDYSWRKPLTQVIDGAPAILNPTTWDWVRPTDKTQVRPATIPEIADYVGTDVKTAEDIKNNTKPKEDDTVVKPNGSLKNPTKKLVFTPLMMTATTMTKKFPFSVPWDFANQLKVFNVEPTTPKIEINAPSFVTIGGVSSGMVFDIDFKMFDPIAAGIRWLLVIGFDIALILMLRKLLPE